jgi:hypothetical protein
MGWMVAASQLIGCARSSERLTWTAVHGYEPIRTFDRDTAEEYDELAVRGDEEATVAFLGELARDGPALELAIGT